MRLIDSHRTKVAPLIEDGKLTLKREFYPSEKSKFQIRRRMPRNSRFELVEDAIKGKRKSGYEEALKDLFPDYGEHFSGVTSKEAALESIDTLIQSLPDDAFEFKYGPLPSGIDAGIANFLPETVYIPASKDVKEDLKTSGSARFAKLLGLLIEAIEQTQRVSDVEDSLELLHGMFNRVAAKTGELSDKRLDPIRILERAIQEELRNQFRDASIELAIPKPDLKQLFANGFILVDDGVKNDILLKGDGVKRSLMFSLIKVYIDLVRHNKLISSRFSSAMVDDENPKPSIRPYLFLFEEPELFLHPNAQEILYEALKELSTLEHQVIISTHSAAFFGPDDETMFLKVQKQKVEPGKPPCVCVRQIDLKKHLFEKEAYQIICYESNAAAFFSDRVILVEGPSDQAYLTALTKVLNPEWCTVKSNTAIVVIGGKTNVSKYRKFYEAAGIEVFVLLDYDALFDGYKYIGMSGECTELRRHLLADIDSHVTAISEYNFSSEEVNSIKSSYKFQDGLKHLSTLLDSEDQPIILADEDVGRLRALLRKPRLTERSSSRSRTRSAGGGGVWCCVA